MYSTHISGAFHLICVSEDSQIIIVSPLSKLAIKLDLRLKDICEAIADTTCTIHRVKKILPPYRTLATPMCHFYH